MANSTTNAAVSLVMVISSSSPRGAAPAGSRETGDQHAAQGYPTLVRLAAALEGRSAVRRRRR